MSGSLGRFAAGLALKGLLRRLTGEADPAATAAAKRRKRRRTTKRTRGAARQVRHGSGPVAHKPPARGAAFFVMMGSLALTLPLMLIFETTLTRIVGVVMLFTFIVSGVFAIAQPAFLESDDEQRA